MRLTIRNSDGSVPQPTNVTIKSVFDKLAEYEEVLSVTDMDDRNKEGADE